MSRPGKVSKRDQNGSLTSEPDSMSQKGTGHPKTSSDRSRSAQSASRGSSRNDTGPDTSTPVKPGKPDQGNKATFPGHDTSVRRRLADELEASQTSNYSTTSSSAGAVQRINDAAYALAVGPPSPGMSSIRPDDSTTLGMTSGVSRRSFTSEFESGTIQAQRQELQLLMLELKDRDRELNEMVKAHHNQLLGWEEDRQRILNLERRNAQLEADSQRKNDQVRALVARLKTMESVEQSKRTALDSAQSQLSAMTEQLSQSELKVKETQEKNKQMGHMVKELSNTLNKLEAKEQEMLSLLELKDKDLTSASTHISELSSKLKSLDTKVKQYQRVEVEVKKDVSLWKDKYTECKREVDKLKTDLNRSQQEEEGSRLELDRAKREQDRLRKQLAFMSEREKRQEEMISSQRLKQERTDSELTSIRTLYERQQRDLSLLQLNLDSTKEILAKQKENIREENGNISLLLQSPTSGKPVAYYTGENTVSLRTATDHKTPRNTNLATAARSPLLALTSTNPPSSPPPTNTESSTPTMSSVGPGHHLPTQPGALAASSSAAAASSGSHQGTVTQQTPRIARSGIPVMVQDKGTGQRVTGVARPSSVTGQYRDSSVERSRRASSVQGTMQTIRSQSCEHRSEVVYSSFEQNNHQTVHGQNQQRQQEALQYQQQPQQQQQQQQPRQQQNQQQQQQQHLTEDENSMLEQLKQLQAFSKQLQQNHPIQGSPTQMTALSERPNTPPPPTNQSIPNTLPQPLFGTPPRLVTSEQRTPSPKTVYRTVVVTSPNGSMMSQGGASASHRAAEEDSVGWDYPQQTGLSATGEESALSGSRDLQEEDGTNWTGASGSTRVISGREDPADVSMPESPTTKLHRLLTESRQMVQTLERSTYPPFFTQEPLSPIKMDSE